MKRRCWLALVLTALGGCRMGQDPYDYSGPVQGSPPIPYGATTARSGSVLSGSAPTSNAVPPTVPQPPTTPNLSPEPPSEDPITRNPGSKTIRR